MDNPNDNPYAASGPKPHPEEDQSYGLHAFAALVAGIANVGAVGTMLTLINTPSGVAIRPMGHSAISAMFALLGLFVGATLSLTVIRTSRGSRRSIGVCLLIASLAPFPLSTLTMHMLAGYCGFTLKP